MQLDHIEKVESVDDGGGNYVDLITLYSGKVIGINGDCIVLYGSMKEFTDDVRGDEEFPTIDL